MRRFPLILALAVVCSSAFVAQQRPSPEQGMPPTNLGEREGYWTANNAPEGAEDFEVYVVAEGDTLWALAERLLNDSFLWPQLWETNEHIVNPHWIYPNDKILIRPLTRITEAEPPPPVTTEPEPEPAPEAEPRPIRPVRLPATPRLTDSAAPAPPPIGFDLPDPILVPEVKAAESPEVKAGEEPAEEAPEAKAAGEGATGLAAAGPITVDAKSPPGETMTLLEKAQKEKTPVNGQIIGTNRTGATATTAVRGRPSRAKSPNRYPPGP